MMLLKLRAVIFPKNVFIFAIVLLWTLGSPSFSDDFVKPDSNSKVQELINHAKEQGKPIWLHFEADWCGPCRELQSTIFSKPSFITAIPSEIVAIKVNATIAKETVKRLGITSLPSDRMIVDGNFVVAETGVQSLETYLSWFKRVSKMIRQKSIGHVFLEGSSEAFTLFSPTEGRHVLKAIQGKIQVLDGYCPLSLAQKSEYIKANDQTDFGATARVTSNILDEETTIAGIQFAFAPWVSAEDISRIQKSSDTGLVAFGFDIIEWNNTRRFVLGDMNFMAIVDSKIYSFSCKENLDIFKSDSNRQNLSIPEIEGIEFKSDE